LLSFHRKLDDRLIAVEMFQKYIKHFFTVRPNNKGVVHVSKPYFGLEPERFDRYTVKFLHENIRQNRRQRRSHWKSFGLFVELTVEQKIRVGQAMLDGFGHSWCC